MGELLPNPDLARTFHLVCRAEADARGKGRVAGLEAAQVGQNFSRSAPAAGETIKGDHRRQAFRYGCHRQADRDQEHIQRVVALHRDRHYGA